MNNYSGFWSNKKFGQSTMEIQFRQPESIKNLLSDEITKFVVHIPWYLSQLLPWNSQHKSNNSSFNFRRIHFWFFSNLYISKNKLFDSVGLNNNKTREKVNANWILSSFITIVWRHKYYNITEWSQKCNTGNSCCS